MLKIIFNSLLGLGLIFIWSKFVNLGEIFQTISKANIPSLGLVVIFMLLSPIIRAIRLKVFLSKIKNIPLLDLIFLNGVAMMLNFFIPIRAGEVAKGVYLNTRFNLNLGKSIIWIFLDRFVDFMVVLLLASILLFIVPTNLPESLSKTVALIFTGALVMTYLAVFQINLTKKLVVFLKHLLIVNAIKIQFEKFSHFILESFSVLNRSLKDLSLIVFLSVLAYVADALIWYFIFVSLGQTQQFIKMFLSQLLSALTYLIPAAPGYVGSAEASGLLIFSGVFGIDPNLASAMTVLFHILFAIFVLIFGLVSVFNLKIDLGLILKKAFKKG